jgi:hypothetical protein
MILDISIFSQSDQKSKKICQSDNQDLLRFMFIFFEKNLKNLLISKKRGSCI